MGGIINFFKNLIGGIVGFISGLLGGKKQGEFFLELDETQSPEAAPAVMAAVATPEAAAVGTPESPAAAPKATKKAKKDAEAKKVAEAPAAPAPVANPVNLPKPTITFAEASKAAPAPTPRRRPGANMGAYIDMAKTVNRA